MFDPLLPADAEVEPVDTQYAEFLDNLGEKAHFLINNLPDRLPANATFEGDRKQFLEELLGVTKRLFDFSVKEDTKSIKHLSAFLDSIKPSADTPVTRSSAKSKKAKLDAQKQSQPLQPTPIEELFLGDKFTPLAIWDQLELKGGWLSKVAEKVVGMEQDLIGEESDESEDSKGDESDSSVEEEEVEDVPLGPDYVTSLNDEGSPHNKKKRKRALLDGEDEEDDMVSRIPILKSTQSLPKSRSDSAVDDDFFSLSSFHRETDAGERDFQTTSDFGIDLFAPVLDEQGDDTAASDLKFKDFFAPPPRAPKHKSSTTHPPVKEETKNGKKQVSFSSVVRVKPIQPRPNAGEGEILRKLILKFGVPKVKMLLTKEKGNIGKLSEMLGPEDWEEDSESDSNSEEDGEDFGMDEEDAEWPDGFEGEDLDMEGVEGADGLMDQDDDESESEDDEADGDQQKLSAVGSSSKGGTATMRRMTKDLFSDDISDSEDESESETTNNARLTKHESRLRSLTRQIQSLEEENVSQKEWMMRGEVRSKERPVNSLLEQDLEFEHVSKVVPVVTQERTESLEEMIKRRILEGSFDDVVRKHSYDLSALLPSRYFELENTQSQKSLAEIYEDEFNKDKAAAVDPTFKKDAALDEKTKKQHAEIELLFEQLSSKLDALSNARFTPKAPNTTITTITNLPSLAMESALPTATSAATLLAPEEIYTANSSSSKDALTPAQKKSARQKKRKERKAIAERIQRAKEKRGGGGKKEMMEKLVGRKGVTVIGKDKHRMGKKPVKGKENA
ncbi:Mpp10 protein [Atractiella rhizophila]|nr:Mpp10 protein [Atractiella rhizophila]